MVRPMRRARAAAALASPAPTSSSRRRLQLVDRRVDPVAGRRGTGRCSSSTTSGGTAIAPEGGPGLRDVPAAPATPGRPRRRPARPARPPPRDDDDMAAPAAAASVAAWMVSSVLPEHGNREHQAAGADEGRAFVALDHQHRDRQQRRGRRPRRTSPADPAAAHADDDDVARPSRRSARPASPVRGRRPPPRPARAAPAVRSNIPTVSSDALAAPPVTARSADPVGRRRSA